jgi:pilus assembly protein CpaB
MLGERRYRFVLYFALAIATAATFGVYRVITAMRASSRIATRPVVVAAIDIPEGHALTATDLKVAQWPEATVPAGIYETADSLVGRVARVSVFTGEAIVPGRLAPAGTTAGLEVKITPGKRAMSVRIDDVAGIAGMMQPNSRVDVLVTIRDMTEGVQKQVAKLFMSNMRVLSIGAQVQRDGEGKAINAPTATLEVTPDEAERLAVAMREGSIQLVMRGYGDPDSIVTTGAYTEDVLSQLRDGSARPKPAPVRTEPVAAAPRPRQAPVRAAPAPAPAPTPAPVVQAPRPRPESTTVRVFRGSNMSQQTFSKDTATKP